MLAPSDPSSETRLQYLSLIIFSFPQDKILRFPAVLKRLNENILKEVSEKNPRLLKTIIFPKRIHYLTGRLPEANYKILKTISIDKKHYMATLSGAYPGKDSQTRQSM